MFYECPLRRLHGIFSDLLDKRGTLDSKEGRNKLYLGVTWRHNDERNRQKCDPTRDKRTPGSYFISFHVQGSEEAITTVLQRTVWKHHRGDQVWQLRLWDNGESTDARKHLAPYSVWFPDCIILEYYPNARGLGPENVFQHSKILEQKWFFQTTSWLWTYWTTGSLKARSFSSGQDLKISY